MKVAWARREGVGMLERFGSAEEQDAGGLLDELLDGDPSSFYITISKVRPDDKM